MLEIKEFGKRIRIDYEITDQTRKLKASELISEANCGVKFLGIRVLKTRECEELYEYQGKIFYLFQDVGTCGKGFIDLLRFDEDLAETEPIENYKYYIDYCNPEIDDEFSIYLYYKEEEFELAMLRQQELGEDLAFLKEIK